MPENKKQGARAQAGNLSAVMYLGPNQAYGLPIMQYQVFTGDAPPEAYAAKIKEHACLKACFVPVAKAGEAIKKLGDPKSDIALAAALVAKESKAARLIKNKA